MPQQVLLDVQNAIDNDDVKSALKQVEEFLTEHSDDPDALRLKLDCCLSLDRHHDFINEYLFSEPHVQDATLDDARDQAHSLAMRALETGHEALTSYRRPNVLNACRYFARAVLLSPDDISMPLAFAKALIKNTYSEAEEQLAKSIDVLLNAQLRDDSPPTIFEFDELTLVFIASGDETLEQKHIKPIIRLFLEIAIQRGLEQQIYLPIMRNLNLLDFNLEGLLAEHDLLEPTHQQQLLERSLVFVMGQTARLIRNGQFADARGILDQLMVVTPNQPYLYLMVIEIDRLQQNYDTVLENCALLMTAFPEEITINWELLAEIVKNIQTIEIVCTNCLKTNRQTSTCRYCYESLTEHRLFMDKYAPHHLSLVSLVKLIEADIFESREDHAIDALNAAQAALADALKQVKDSSTVSTIRKYVNQLERSADQLEILAKHLVNDLHNTEITTQMLDDIQMICQQDPSTWQTIRFENRQAMLSALIAHNAIALAHTFMRDAFSPTDALGDLETRLHDATRALSIQLTNEAQDHLDAGYAETAIEIATEAIRFNSLNMDAHWVRAHAFLGTGQAISAVSEFKTVLQSNASPHREAALQHCVSQLEILGNYKEALSLITAYPTLVIPDKQKQQLERRLENIPYIKTTQLSDAVMVDTLRRIPCPPYWNSIFALKLTSVGRQRTNTDAWISTAFNASYEFVRVLGGLSSIVGEPSIALRLISDPVPEASEQGTLKIAFIAKLVSTDQTMCQRNAFDFWKIIKSSLPSFFKQYYQFEPVVNEQELDILLEPFEYSSLAEIVRREEMDSNYEEELSAYPFLPGEITLRQVCRVLLNQDAPALLNITLVPTRLLGWEKSILDRLPESLSEIEKERTPDGIAVQMSESNLPGTLREFREQIQVNQHLFASLRSQAFVMRLTAAGAPNTNPLLPEQIATVLLGSTQVSSGGVQGGSQIVRVNTDEQMTIVRRNLSQLEVENWMVLDPQNASSRMRYLFGGREATFAFRLPVTSEEGLPGIKTLDAKPVPPPANLPENGVLIGESVYRISGSSRVIRQNSEDRRRHTYIVGKTGTGKSTLLKSMALQDIQAGHGVCVIDPHGDLIEDLLLRLPPERADDVILFDPSDDARPVGLNLLQHRTETEKHQIVSEFIALLIRMYDPDQQGIVGPRFQHNVRNAMLTAMSLPDSTLIEVVRVLTDTSYVRQVLPYVSDPIVRAYWEKQIANTSDYHKSEILDYIVSKFNRFVGDRRVRHIVGQRHSMINFRTIMDEKKILLVNLSKGKVGPENAQFLGLLVVQSMLIAALSRADMPANQRADFFMYVDEFQNFATNLFTTILSEGRKYGVALTVANQYLTQLTPPIREAIFGNVGSILSFRLGVQDAQLLATEMTPSFNAYDLINLPRYTVCAKLLVNGVVPPPFTLYTLPDSTPLNLEQGESTRRRSRYTYGRDVRRVIEDIDRRFKENL